MLDPELKQLSDQLAQMMADPHPGLITWRHLLGRTLLRLAAFCGIESVAAEAFRLSEQPEYRISGDERRTAIFDRDSASVEVRKNIAKFIQEQNAMVNQLLDNPGRHDAFVSDIVKAILAGRGG